MKKLLLSSCIALALSSGLWADTFTLSAINGGAAAGAPQLNLNNLALGGSTQWADANLEISFVGNGGVVNGSASGLYAAPYVSGNNGIGFGSPDQPTGVDTTNYLSSGIGSIVFSFASPQNYFGLLWGSVDNYNTLSFYSGATLLHSFTGTDVWASANGDQGVNGTYYVNIANLDGHFDRVVANSTQYAFEIDNIAYNNRGGANVPDSGSTLAMIGGVLVTLAAIRRRR